jgi:hypothetical protein
LIDNTNLVPFFCLDICASGFEPVDNFRIVKSKGNLGNFDILLSWSINSVVWEFIHSLFKLKLDVELKLLDFSNRVSMVMVIEEEFFIDCLTDIKLDCVISRSNCFDIKVNILCLLESLDIINVHNSEKVNENGSAGSDQSEDLTLIHVPVSFWEKTWSLEIKERVFAAFSRCVFVEIIDVLCWICQIKGARFFSLAFCKQ